VEASAKAVLSRAGQQPLSLRAMELWEESHLRKSSSSRQNLLKPRSSASALSHKIVQLHPGHRKPLRP